VSPGGVIKVQAPYSIGHLLLGWNIISLQGNVDNFNIVDILFTKQLRPPQSFDHLLNSLSGQNIK
jgi:hypothetical protein